MLKDKKILLGITGSVAAYKAIDLIKLFRQKGAVVEVIMTSASTRFISPMSISIASGSRVHTDMFEDHLAHINLPLVSDLFVVAPATANIISKCASGLADDLLSSSLLAYNRKALFAPAMNWRMYENPVFRKNLDYLASLDHCFVGPERGSLACGEEGIGRMAKVEHIVDAAEACMSSQDFSGERVIVTAGPTREHIDPVRYLTNRSSGKMGFAIARAARRRGASVTLIKGPCSIEPPYGVEVVDVDSAADMHKEVMQRLSSSTILIMSAAVADFTPSARQDKKIEKSASMTLNLVRTADIIAEAGASANRPFIVGFSAETGSSTDRAVKKMKEKNMDMIVFNDVSRTDIGFDCDMNEVVIIDRSGSIPLPMMSKDGTADAILDRVAELKKLPSGG
ncbi:MAG: bifunctional phosphopantothenoylcysteine decarboxylase/phosphopantothenate--cysteine ligase CoaBC [Nitrospiraceae bacterium]|nr:bifunctional phosphopantothenoylcysteine decarboxylase/phosphopantothenate--cysteine ligase CoaBC [Nitrospiraceae bacterium]